MVFGSRRLEFAAIMATAKTETRKKQKKTVKIILTKMSNVFVNLKKCQLKSSFVCLNTLSSGFTGSIKKKKTF